ncbi:MAG: tetratricopeptide repeat protein [Bacteroidales bacterium]|nr:tetratricopeptide repeat protein [Bacteroidales bacterium]
MEQIKSVGNEDPRLAMAMYDSIQTSVENSSEYIRMKGVMLEMRLRDKAYWDATTSDSAQIITAYFDKHGKGTDAAEAHYYAGSAYRDLKDMPNALKHFLKAEELLNDENNCDSLLLSNTYSNLAYVYLSVQDYNSSLKMALREYDIDKRIHNLNIIPILRIGETYLRMNCKDLAFNYYKEALDSAYSNLTANEYAGLGDLLYELSFLKKENAADSCFALIRKLRAQVPLQCLSEYYILKNEIDSAIVCYKHITEETQSLDLLFDAYKNLYYSHYRKGNQDSICKYAALYIQISDSIDFGKRQELAATVNNQYHYYRNAEEEAKIKEENMRFRLWLYIIIGGTVVLVLLFSLFYMKKKNKYLKEALLLTEELTHSKKLLAATKSKLENTNKEIADYERELKEKEQRLLEKLEENKRFILLLHKADLEEHAEDVVLAIKKASEGQYSLTDKEWQRFYRAVDELQPDLAQKMSEHLGRFTEQQQQVCYLMSVGLSNKQIENLTGLSHATTWRWTKKMDWLGK